MPLRATGAPPLLRLVVASAPRPSRGSPRVPAFLCRERVAYSTFDTLCVRLFDCVENLVNLETLRTQLVVQTTVALVRRSYICRKRNKLGYICTAVGCVSRPTVLYF